METVAKVLNLKIGRNKLFEILKKENILMANNNPKQEYCDRNYFKVIEESYTTEKGTMIGYKTVVYQKGIDFILKLFKSKYPHLIKQTQLALF